MLMTALGIESQVVVQDWAPDAKGVPHGLILAKSRFTEAEAARWAQVIGAIRGDGTLKRIFSRYLPADEAGQMLDF
jgi:polar amino acid transport system substrate-binding protein